MKGGETDASKEKSNEADAKAKGQGREIRGRLLKPKAPGGKPSGAQLLTVYQGDCIERLREMEDASVQCCVTTPPYFNQRDYGTAGQIGLEKTPEEYVAKMVAVFREVRRVLKDDGVVFLNLGDSYFGGGGGGGSKGSKQKTNSGSLIPGHTRAGARRAIACDTSGKAPVNYQASDCLCGSLCDACRKAYQIGKSRSDSQLDPKLIASPCAPTRERKEFASAHSPTSDSSLPVIRIGAANQGSVKTGVHAAELLRASPATTIDESSRPLHASSHQSDQPSGCRLCGCSLQHSIPASADKSASPSGPDSAFPATQDQGRSTTDTRETACACSCRTSGIRSDSLGYLTTASHQLKPKDLVGIPWMVAFALRADGWYLRQDIIWAKPNPMTESVQDRCTKSHEYIFLLSKSARYYYDSEAIKEPADRPEGSGNKKPYVVPGEREGENANKGGSMHKIGPRETRNKRSVWTVPTAPYPDAHFAVYPSALITPCILAGSRAGDVVLDPFGGSGTTGMVALELGRKAILIELNPDYIVLIKQRCDVTPGLAL